MHALNVLANIDLPSNADLATAALGGLLILAARVCDVSLGTLRTIYMLRGRRLTASVLAVFESAIFITAISAVLSGGVLHEPFKVIGYVLGFATGVFVGMTIERRIASGWTLVRVVERDRHHELAERLRADGEAVTTVAGEGRDGPSPILFAVIRRKRTPAVLGAIREIAPQAFVTLDSVGQAINGTIPASSPSVARLGGLRLMFRK